MRIMLDCIINKVKRRAKRLSLYLMSNINQVTSQCSLNSSNGLCGEVMATSEPLGNLGISLMEHSGKVFLGETFFLQNLTQSLCYAKRQVKLSLLFGRNRSKAITEKFILYHHGYISKVAERYLSRQILCENLFG